MTRIDDPPERADTEIVLTGDLASRPPGTIQSVELVGADELTDEGEFPQHGEFLAVEVEGEQEFWEVAGGLREEVAEHVEKHGTEPEGAALDVRQVSKTPSGEWRFVISLRGS